MVFFLLMSFMDVVIAVIMIATHLDFLHQWRLAIMGSAYLIGKGILFKGNLLSFLDVLAGIYFLLLMFGLKTFLVYIFAGVMIYKFVVSLVMRG